MRRNKTNTLAPLSKWWVFTINNPNEQLDFADAGRRGVVYVVWQYERGDAGTPHFQGYIEFSKQVRRKWADEALGGHHAHLEPRRGTQVQAVAYASKHESRIDGPWTFGSAPAATRTFKELCEAVAQGEDPRVVAQEAPDLAVKHWRGYEWLAAQAYKPKWRDVRVFFLTGPTGTGKSSLVYDTFGYDNVYSLASEGPPLWFGSYRRQRVLFIDEYKGSIERETLLKILDGHPFEAPVKGGFVWARWDVVVFASNNDPTPSWDDALRRRLRTGGRFRVERSRGQYGDLAGLLRGDVGLGVGVSEIPERRVSGPLERVTSGIGVVNLDGVSHASVV